MAALTAESYLRPDVIRQVQRFDLKAKFVMNGFLAGLHRSPFKGFSVEFSDYRKYVAGDDTRTVDWKLWSRTDRYYVKQYEAETNMTGHLVVDCSASMGYAGMKGQLSKLEYATYLAGAMAYMMVHQQDPVGLITFGEEVLRFVRAKSKGSHLFTLLRVLAEAQPAGKTNVAQCLHQVAEMVPHRGLVIICSDLLEDEHKVMEALAHLRYRGHDVIIFQIFEACEAQFPFDQLTRFQDIEGVIEDVTTEPHALRAAYLEEIRKFLEYYRAECTQRRIDFIPVDTATSFDHALLAYLHRRCGK